MLVRCGKFKRLTLGQTGQTATGCTNIQHCSLLGPKRKREVACQVNVTLMLIVAPDLISASRSQLYTSLSDLSTIVSRSQRLSAR